SRAYRATRSSTATGSDPGRAAVAPIGQRSSSAVSRWLRGGTMMAAARTWAPTRTAVVAVSSGAAIAGTSERPVATAVTATNRRRSRTGQHDAQSGTDDGPPRERGDRNGLLVDLETDIGRARD